MKSQLWIAISLLICPPLWAGSLSAPFDLENTAVVPKNINNPRLRGVWVQLSENYNGTGGKEALGTKLNKQVTWDDVVRAQEASLQPIVKASINSVCETGTECAEKGEGPGQTTGQAEINMNVSVPTYVRGITDNTSFILAIPVYTVDVQVSTGFASSLAYKKWMATFKGDPYQQSQVEGKFRDPVATKASDYGYRPLESRSFRRLGDIKIGGKTKFDSDGRLGFAVKYLATVPTGTAPDADELVDVPTGDGGYAMGLTGIAELAFTDYFSMVSSVGYNHQFADRIERRIPVNPGDGISADKEVLSRKRGNQYLAGVSVLAGRSTKGFSVGAGYTFQYMEPTRFNGGQYAAERYKYLDELNPSQSMQSGTLLAQFSTIDSYREKRFVAPLNVSLSYSNVFAGVNVPKSDLISSELVLFF
jgi:hypothetical protein